MNQRVREYELLDVLGKGGMGEVYRARHIHLDTEVAVKVIRSALADDPRVRTRFLREAKTIYSLQSPNIVRCETVFEEGQRLYMVMELLRGESLRERLKRLPPDWRRDESIFYQALEATAYAHSRGVIHRDLKPSNIFIQSDGRVKVLDFGLARELGGSDLSVTNTSEFLGTPAYMPPEAFTGEKKMHEIGPEGDVFALGVIAYQMAAGRLPFPVTDDATSLDAMRQLMRFHLSDEPIAPLARLRPGLPAALTGAVTAALSHKLSQRPADAGKLLALLRTDSGAGADWAGKSEQGADQTFLGDLPDMREAERKRQTGAAAGRDRKRAEEEEGSDKTGLALPRFQAAQNANAGQSAEKKREIPPPPQQEAQSGNLLKWGTAIAGILIVILGFAFFYKGKTGEVTPPPPAVEAPAPAAEAPAAPLPVAASVASKEAQELEDRAWKALDEKKYKEAVDLASQALAKDATRTDAMNVLGVVRAVEGNKAEARIWFNKVLAIKADDKNAQTWMKRLK